MNVLVPFFLKYLLAPILVLLSLLIMNLLAKSKKTLKMKNLIIAILICALIVALPAILGLLRFEFVWGGLLISIVLFLILGYCFNLFTKTALFETIGLESHKGKLFFMVFIICLLGGWLYYLLFDFLSHLHYSAWAMTNVLWFSVPIFYAYSREIFQGIPTPFYSKWELKSSESENEYWNAVDTFRLMQVTVRIKRRTRDKKYTSFSVKVPEDIELGKWFNRFMDDQTVRFPESPMDKKIDGIDCGWIFYTPRWFSFPMFTRVLDFNKSISDNRIKSKSQIYIRRVAETDNQENKDKKDTKDKKETKDSKD